MKPDKLKNLRKMTDEELLELKKTLEFQKLKASSPWGLGNIKEDKTTRGDYKVKGITNKGTKTSLKKDTKKNIARILTILNERRRLIT